MSSIDDTQNFFESHSFILTSGSLVQTVDSAPLSLNLFGPGPDFFCPWRFVREECTKQRHEPETVRVTARGERSVRGDRVQVNHGTTRRRRQDRMLKLAGDFGKLRPRQATG